MSMRYPGGLIATSPVNARYPSGVWTQAQAAPYQAQNVWTRDQFWPYTTLLLQGDGAVNGAQNNTFLDSSSNNFTITRNGNTTQGAFTPYEQDGYWSNYFGATGQYLSVAYSSAFNLTGDFTIECWINPGNLPSSTGSAAQSYERIFSFGTYNAANSLGLEINSNDSGNLRRFISWYNGTSYGLGSNNAVAPGNWYHIAMVRSGTTITLYLNGTSIGTITGASAAVNTSQAFYIASLQGFEGDASAAFNGYISNFRLVKGTAVYTANFTPPAAPLTAITNTSLLTCQSNRFRDNSTNNFTVTPNGASSVQSFQPFPGATTWSASVLGGSGYFDGTGDYLAGPNNAAFAFGTGDFTIEAWVNSTNYSGTNAIFDTRSSGNESTGVILYIRADGRPEMYRSAAVVTGSTALSQNTWNHVALTRSGSTCTLWLNGVNIGTATDATNLTQQNSFVGAAYTGVNNLMVGYISNLRVVKGTAVYTGAFTPPTAPLTAITNTSLLLNFTNAGIYDNSMMNNLETVGNAQVSTSVVKYGTGSMAFDGNGDYLLPPSSPNLAFGTGDCTIEFWYYANSSQGTRTILVGNNLGFTTNAWNIQINNTSPSITNKLQLWAYNLNSSAVAIQGNTTLVANNWYHVALVRNGSTFTFYLNGVSEGTTTSSASLDGGGSKTVSIARDGTDYFNGYIDDLRITKGAARYITNFTPPPARMPGQ